MSDSGSELTVWGADRRWVRFGPTPRTGDLAAWAYWHGWTSEVLVQSGWPFDVVLVNLRLGLGPTCVIEQLRPPMAFELVDLGGQRLLSGELQRGQPWQLVAVHLPGGLTRPVRALRILARLHLTYPLAVIPNPQRVPAWLAGAPALGPASERLRGLLPGVVPA